MADHQDQFYASTESDAFFDRWKNSVDGQNVDGLRKNKRSILDQLTENENLRGKRVLEVGCFIGDLLATLWDDFECHVHGVESSQKACDYAKEQFNLLRIVDNNSYPAFFFYKNKKYIIKIFNATKIKK